MSKITKLVASATIALALVLSVVAAPVASAQTVEELQAQIDSLMATITALQAQLGVVQATTPTTTVGGYTFSKNLKAGMSDAEVKSLQEVLNSDADTQVAASGVGSAGNETMYFGSLTTSAVIKFQNKYASDVLTPVGLTAGTGYVGASTRAKLNALFGGTPVVVVPPVVTPGTETPVVTTPGTGLSVSAGTQPVAGYAPQGATRVPFTKVVLTAGTDGPVTVNNITVERTGFAHDNVFAGIVLVDEAGIQLGLEKTLNSSHQATVGEAVTIPAGTSKTFTIAGNMLASGMSSYSGETPYLSVVAVNTSASVSGMLPITGTGHVTNASVTIGSLSASRGSLDPGVSQTAKEIGTTGYIFSSVKLTAGSAEEVRVKSIKWNQSGSAAKSDLANVKTYVDDVAYDTVVSADGKYYTSVLDDGIVIDKGANLELSIKGDIVDGATRTIDFDVYKRTDIYATGETYHYGINPANGTSAATADTGAVSSTNPWYDAFQVTNSAGTMTVSSWTGVGSQNIGVNSSDQELGGFTVDAKGEKIAVASLVFTVATTTGTGDPGLLTNVSIIDENGFKVGGPVDATDPTVTDGNQTLTFTDTITFPTGIHSYKLVGKVPSSTGNGMTYVVSFTPSTAWTNVTGQTTGNTITPAPASAVTLSTMTVRGGSLTVSVSTQPTAKTIISGANELEFARYVFNAGQSGEDVRLSSIPVYYDTTGTRTDLTNCYLFDGTTKVSDVLNPSTSDTASSTNITFAGGIVIPKGTTKTLSMKCNIKTGVTTKYWWGLDTGQTTSYTGATGVTSGQTIAESMNESSGQIMTAAANGSYTVTNDTTIAYKIVQADTAGVTLAAYNFTAGLQEGVTLKQIALQLGNTASNSPSDFVNQTVTLWNGSTQVGSAHFDGANDAYPDYATSTLSTPVVIAAGATVKITVKATLVAHDANTNTDSTAGNGGYGSFLAVNYDGNNNGSNGNYATGNDSGATISGTSSDTSTSGIRVFKTVPTIEDVTTASALIAGSDLYKIKVTAGSKGDIALRRLSFSVVGSGPGTTSFSLYGPSGMVHSAATATTSDTNITGDRLTIVFTDTNVDRKIEAGSSKTYSLRATTIPGLTTTGTESLSFALLQDTAYSTSSGAYLMSTVSGIEADNTASTTNYMVWTPFSTTTSATTAAINANLDWTNSYGLPGFPSVGQNMSSRTFSD